MNKTNAFVSHALVHYRKWNFFIFTVLTILLLLNGQTTVFYLIYFFWWNEIVRIIIDKLFYKHNPDVVLSNPNNVGILASIMQMGVYFVFIVVFLLLSQFEQSGVTND